MWDFAKFATDESGHTLTLKERAQLNRFSRLISSRYGISRPVDVARIAPEDPKVFLTKLPQTDFSVYGGVNSFAAGCSPDPLQSLVSACGEAIERYAGFRPDPSQYLYGTYQELKFSHDVMSPSEFSFFSPEQYQDPQFRVKPFTSDLNLAWICLRSQKSGKNKWFPLDIFMELKQSGLNHINRATSSGLAAGPNFEFATESALLELIERDAVMMTWWQKKSCPRVRWMEVLHADWAQAFSAIQNCVEVLDIATDVHVPVVMAIYRGQNSKGEPALLVSAAAARDYATATLKAMTELSHLLIRGRSSFLLRQKTEVPKDPNEVRDFLSHVLYYHREENRLHAEFLWSSPVVRDTKELIQNNIKPGEGIAKVLADAGFESWVVDLTPPDVASLGFHVARAYVPKLVPINASHRYRYWGFPRLGPGPFNSQPHPFS